MIAAVLAAAVFLGCGGGGDEGAAATPLPPEELAAELREAVQMNGVMARVERIVGLMGRLDESNREAAVAVFHELGPSTPQIDMQIFLARLTELDPKIALEAALDFGVPSMRRFAVGVVASDWAARGGGIEASRFLRDEGELSVRDTAFGEMVKGWVRSGDNASVTEFLSELPNSDGRDALIQNVVLAILLKDGVEGVVEWADAIPEDAPENLKKVAFRRALRAVSNRDAPRAARWQAAHRHAEDTYARNTITIVATEWVEQDPQAAVEWLATRSDSRDHRWAMGRTMDRWTRVDPPAATRWLRSQKLTEELDPMTAAWARVIARSNPAQASKLVPHVQDEGLRERLVLYVGSAWKALDPEAAEEWVDSLDVSADTRDKFRRVRGGVPEAQRLIMPDDEADDDAARFVDPAREGDQWA